MRAIAGVAVGALVVVCTLILMQGVTQMATHGPQLLERLDALIGQVSRRSAWPGR